MRVSAVPGVVSVPVRGGPAARLPASPAIALPGLWRLATALAAVPAGCRGVHAPLLRPVATQHPHPAAWPVAARTRAAVRTVPALSFRHPPSSGCFPLYRLKYCSGSRSIPSAVRSEYMRWACGCWPKRATRPIRPDCRASLSALGVRPHSVGSRGGGSSGV